MTVTLYSITPPTSHSSRYLLRPTVLVAPPPRTDILDDAWRTVEARAQHTDEPLAEDDLKITLHLGGPLVVPDDSLAAGYRETAAQDHALAEHDMGAGADTLDDIDSMYRQRLEDPDLAWEKSAEITRFP